MRKIILIGVLIITILFSMLCVINGLSGPIKINSFKEIQEKNDLITQKLNELTTLKSENFKIAESDLKKAITEHDSNYKVYEQVAGTKTEEEKQKALLGQAYDLEYIWVTLGTYASESKCDLTLELSKNQNESEDTTAEVCDLKIQVVGAYTGVINFIERVSTDNDLKIIPENLKMYSEYRTVQLVDEESNETEEGTKKLMLVTEFYKTNIPVSKNTILEVESQEQANNAANKKDKDSTINIKIKTSTKGDE